MSIRSINNNFLGSNRGSMFLSSGGDKPVYDFASENMLREKKQAACKERWDRHFSDKKVRTVDGDMVHRTSKFVEYTEVIK